jgi:hypothetical protein
MKRQFTASELAVADLPGLPKTARRMRTRAQREGWQTREVSREGGGPPALEFALDSLPAEARAALVEQQLAESDAASSARALAREIEEAERRAAEADTRAAQDKLAEWNALGGPQKRRAEARLQILLRWQAYRESVGGSVMKARKGFKQLYDERRAGLPAGVHDEVDSFSKRTLRRWGNRYDEHGPIGLRDGGPQGIDRDYETKIDADAELRASVLGLIQDRGVRRLSGANVHRVLDAQYGDDPATDVPSKASVRRYLKAFREENLELSSYLDGPHVFKSEKLVAHGSLSDGIERPNQVWELDSTIATVQVQTPEGARRYALLQGVDVYTRRVMFLLAETSNSAAIALLLRRAMLAWGVPEEVRLDNGKDYTSMAISSLLDTLDIGVERCDPFAPEQKPFVERVFRTLQDSEMMLLPGQMGRSVAEQKKLRDREAARRREGKAPIQLGQVSFGPGALQAWLDNWAEHGYGRREHSALGCSPFEQARRYSGRVRRIDEERALDGLLEPVPRGGTRTVQKKGVQIGTDDAGRARWFTAPALAGEAQVGQRVECYWDARQEGRICVYGRSASTGEREFICWAETGQTGEDLRRIAVESKRKQQERLREEVRRLKEDVGEQDAPWLDVATAQMEEGERIRLMPKAGDTHSTPGLEAAGEAAAAREALDTERELRAENTPGERRRIAELEEAEGDEAAGELERPTYWSSDQECYDWVRRACAAGRRDRIEDNDWQIAEQFADDLGLELPPRESPSGDGDEDGSPLRKVV